MKVIDFHPDDLLDRELLGVLSAPEQRRLLEHLERCDICRLERQLRVDFRAELARPALEQALQSSVSGALRAASVAREPGPPETLPESPVSPRKVLRASRARRRALPALAAVAIVVASGVAAAQSGWGERVWELARAQAGNVFGGAASGGEAAPQAQTAEQGRNLDKGRLDKGRDASAAASAVERSLPAVAAPDIESARESAPEVAVPSTEVAAPKVGAPSVKRARARKAAAQAVASLRGRSTRSSAQGAVEPAAHSEEAARADSNNPRVVSSVASPAAEAILVSNQATAAAPEPVLEGTPAASPAPQEPLVSAATLFDQASSARRQGRIAEALRLYASLRERFITSPEARLSLALVARMRLDQGEPEAAINGFEAYLATFDAALREQAMAGRALALGRLGLTSQEKAGWRDLLRAYPNSSYAELAERRLGDGAIR